MSFAPWGWAGSAAVVVIPGLTDLQQDQSLVDVMVILSIIGAVLTWGFLIYTLWKFRDPATKGRRYG